MSLLGFRWGPICSLLTVRPHLSDSQGFPSLNGTIFDRQGRRWDGRLSAWWQKGVHCFK